MRSGAVGGQHHGRPRFAPDAARSLIASSSSASSFVGPARPCERVKTRSLPRCPGVLAASLAGVSPSSYSTAILCIHTYLLTIPEVNRYICTWQDGVRRIPPLQRRRLPSSLAASARSRSLRSHLGIGISRRLRHSHPPAARFSTCRLPITDKAPARAGAAILLVHFRQSASAPSPFGPIAWAVARPQR